MNPFYCSRKNGNLQPFLSRNKLYCRFQQDPTTYISLGGASSEILGGKPLADILNPAYQQFTQTLQHLYDNQDGLPLVGHTSIGISPYLQGFIQSLQPHLPKQWGGDWMVSLQIDGASAVHASIDILQQYLTHLGDKRKGVAVGQKSYHGPPSTSWGSQNTQILQYKYPVPVFQDAKSLTVIAKQQQEFLEKHKQEISVVLIEPQWGSSGCGQVWPRSLLYDFVEKAHQLGMMVVSDEIMCGLGRHGQGRMFLVDAWDIPVDGLLFGKAIAGGVFPLSGAIIAKGYKLFEKQGWGPHQSHTYSHGAHALSLLTATTLLQHLPQYYPLITQSSQIIEKHLKQLTKYRYYGQGLLWGIEIPSHPKVIQQQLKKEGVLVYCIEKGLLLTPIYNSPLDVLEGAMIKLVKILQI